MKQEKTFPIQWKGWDTVDILRNCYYDVEFTGDFGTFKNGEKFSSILIDYDSGLIEAYNEEGTEVVKSQTYKCIAD